MKLTCIKSLKIQKQFDCSCGSIFEPDLDDFLFEDSGRIVVICPVCGRVHVLVHPADINKIPHSFLCKIPGYYQAIMTWHE